MATVGDGSGKGYVRSWRERRFRARSDRLAEAQLCLQIAQFGMLCSRSRTLLMAMIVHALGCKRGAVYKTVVLMQVPVGEDEQERAGVLLWPW